MATRVEINSTLGALTTVPDLNEIRNEDKSQRVYVSVLSDASNKTKETSTSLTLEENKKFGGTLRSATMPSLGSRPRLFPKPFSKDKSSDTFANVKPPVPTFRSSSLIRKATEETSSLKVVSGNVPPLVDQKVIEHENKAGSEVVTNMTFYTGPSANTVILFETAGTEQSKVSLAQEKKAVDDRRGFSTMQMKDLQCSAKLEKLSQPSETSRSAEGSLHRQVSFSSSLRPVSWNSLKTGEKKDAYEVHTVEKTSEDANNVGSKVDFSTEVQQKPKHRPVSAIFLESLRDQKHRTVEASEEKSPEEKSWPRKPRPLSMDLTAKFEHKDPSSCKKPCSSHESKENESVISFADVGCHDQCEMGPKMEETEFNKGSSSKTNLKCTSQDIGILNNGKYIWETKLKSKSEQTETKPEIMTHLHISERSHEATSERRANTGEKRPDQKETCVLRGCESPAASSEKENNIVRGSVKKHISLFTAENPGTSVDAELLPPAAEKENRCMNIQQRIKELTTENTDVKPGNLRRSLQSRPLSADLTKMFSSPTSSGEVKPEKPAETRNDSMGDMQENQKSKEMKLAHGADFTEAHTTGNPWKGRQIVKINKPEQIERKGSFLGDGQHFSQQGEDSVSFTSNLEKKLKPTTLVEKTYIKTVRATLFDHNVQRHNVAVDHPGTDSALKVNNELEAKHDTVTSGHTRPPWMGGGEESSGVKKEYHKQSDSSKHIADVEKSGKPACSSEDKKITPGILLEKSLVEKSDKPTPKNAADSVLYQRVEPRYEIFQTCGERALSEAIVMAPEKKAMTLRTRKSSVKENKSDEDVLHTGQSPRANSKALFLKDDNIVSETRDTKVFTSKTVLREPNDFASSECTLSEQKKDSDKTATATVAIAEKIPYSTTKSQYLGINEKVNKLHSEIKNEKSEVCSVDKSERSAVVKCSFEKSSFRTGGTDSYEFRTNFDHEIISTSVTKHGAQSPSVLSSGQFCKSSGSRHPNTKVLNVNKEESRAFGLRKSLDLNCKEQGLSLHSTALESSEKIRVLDPEEKIRRSRSNISDLKISERWRRRTLPQDSVKTEEVVWLTPENIKRLSRMDSLQLDEGLVKKRSKKSKEGLEGSEATQTVLGSPEDYFEPKATYFAVTYQVPGNNKEKSFVGTPSASETNTISSSSDRATTNPDPVFPGRSKPLLQQPDKNWMSTNFREDSREVPVNKDRVKEEDRGATFSKSVAFGSAHVFRKDSQQYHERGLDHSKEKIIDVDAFLLKQDLGNTAPTDLKGSGGKVSSYHDTRSPLRFAHLHADSELVPQRRSESYDLSGRKAEDGYRSQILDIDALMAEYKEESGKASDVQDKLSEDHSSFSREKSKNRRNVPDKMTSSYSWKERKGSGHCSVSNKQGDCAEEYHRPEKLILNEKSKEKVELCSPEFDKQKSKDRKFSPPYWGNPSTFFSDKFINSPVEFTRKKTFIVDEDEEVSLTSRNQSPRFVIDKVQPVNVLGMDQKWDVNFASKLSVKAEDGLLQKKLVTKEQFLEASPEGDWSKNVARSSLARNKDNASKTTCENDPSNVRSKSEWKHYASGFGSAPPDLRRSYSEKSRQGKDNVLLVQEGRGRKDLYQGRQSFPLESGWKHKMSAQAEFFFCEDKKASRKDWTKQSSDKPDGTDFSSVSAPRSRHSFYKDRRADNGTEKADDTNLAEEARSPRERERVLFGRGRPAAGPQPRVLACLRSSREGNSAESQTLCYK
ncbi:PREDICTED: uncharacterized protein KIAA1671-like [Apaloderma vittatum]|uniref:uncharacterized protein KIAA1671-like n=1 Tax=Apaloderma vittatum TaxID=57397 RepID=UPI0005214337|nr:PREDICTED: uncharacterized protein KIAA1671-like [Apaloderma vittatum]